MATKLLGMTAALALLSCTNLDSDGPAQAARSALRCSPLPGADEILGMQEKRFIIFGEMHGTQETPELFADFVCAAARRGPVVAGMELPEEEQARLDAYMASDGSAKARSALLSGPHWTRGRDGRASQAMLALIEGLRLMRQNGLKVRALAFRRLPLAPNSQNDGEKAIAQAWRESIGRDPDARLVALVGNIHAMREPFRHIEPAAMHMPAPETLTLGFANVGGSAWTCQLDGCKGRPLGGTGAEVPRGIAPAPNPRPGQFQYDRWYSPGRPFTASPPAVAEAAASTASR